MQMLARSIGTSHTPKMVLTSSGKDATSFIETALGGEGGGPLVAHCPLLLQGPDW